MLNLVLSRSSWNLSYHSVALHRCYHAGKAGGVHTAIQRGLRKSRGEGFRGSKKGLSADDPREKYRVEHRINLSQYEEAPRNNYERNFEKKSPADRLHKSTNAWGERGKTGTRDFERISARGRTGKSMNGLEKRRSTNARSFDKRSAPPWETQGSKPGSRDIPDLRIRLGKRLIAGKEPEDGGYPERPTRPGQSYEETGSRYSGRREREFDNGSRRSRAGKDDERPSRSTPLYEKEDSKRYGRREQDSDHFPRQVRDMKESFERNRDNWGRGSERTGRNSGLPSARSSRRSTEDQSYGPRSYDRLSEPSGIDRYPSLSFKKILSESKPGYMSLADGGPSDGSISKREPEPFDGSTRYSSKFPRANAPRDELSSSSGPNFTQIVDNRIPLSIPYTTPASEFLYGTSVVEAALNSRREPRRKLYKFYIYTGENREDPEQNARLEKLARRNGVEVVRAGNDWLRVMDKMSGGRPHNGYILEASPLPRLPVTSLGQLTTVDGQDGFEVSIDYQSREEATVNGTSNFIKIPRSRHGRKPLVLLLDSIVDPGNLGGIIRTAAFLGVAAIAISVRNSASFTPVVLKASAGASEDVTLFVVNKPSGFVVDSKNAGWKVFAAVAPAKKHDPAMPASMSTDQLDDPLSEDPCILMLGSEGEGLRWNLRSKADVDLYIEGSRQGHNVDSLNVSVAAGILCTSFLKRSKHKEVTPIRQEKKEDKAVPETAKLF